MQHKLDVWPPVRQLAVDFTNGEGVVLKGSVKGVGCDGVGGESVLGRYTKL